MTKLSWHFFVNLFFVDPFLLGERSCSGLRFLAGAPPPVGEASSSSDKRVCFVDAFTSSVDAQRVCRMAPNEVALPRPAVLNRPAGGASSGGCLPVGADPGRCCGECGLSNKLVSDPSAADAGRAGFGPRPISISCCRKASCFESRGILALLRDGCCVGPRRRC